MIDQSKAACRAAVLSELAALSPADREEGSARVCRRLQNHAIWRLAQSVLFYAPTKQEIDVFPLIEKALVEGKRVALPQFDAQTKGYRACWICRPKDDLISGRFGIREPGLHCPSISVKQLDLILVPGLAFDRDGRRLGRGQGYYDRLLDGVRGTKCGLAYDLQVKPQIPVESHDVLLDCILTPDSWLDFRPLRHGEHLVG